VTLLGFVAVLSFWDWLETRRTQPAVIYALLAPLTIFLHLGAGPYVAAPLVFAAILAIAGPAGERPPVRAVAAFALALAVGVAAFLWPARDSFLGLLEAKLHGGSIRVATLVGVAKLQAGVVSAPLMLVVAGVAAVGYARLLGAQPRFAAYVATIATVHVAGLFLLKPPKIEQSVVLSRYLLVLTPFLLLCVAIGLATPWWPQRTTARRRVQWIAIAVSFAVLSAAGPLADRDLWSSSLAHHSDFMAFDQPRPTMAAAAVPDFYHRLARRAATAPVIEFPYLNSFHTATPLRIYQSIHRHAILGSSIRMRDYGPSVAYRNLVPPHPVAFLATDARHLVVHRDLGAEVRRTQGVPAVEPRRRPLELRSFTRLRRRSWRLSRQLRAAWGTPHYSDGTIEVWDLDAVRRRERRTLSNEAPPQTDEMKRSA
jgi:hypothetical protein